MASFWDLLKQTHPGEQRQQIDWRPVVEPLRRLVDLASTPGHTAGKAAVMASTPLGFGAVRGAIKQMSDFAAVVQDAVAPFRQLSDMAARFTQAVDPALVAELNRAFRDLDAVIGQAMRPIVDQARELVRYLAGALMPLMRRLEPLVADLTGKIGLQLKESISKFVTMLDALPWEAIRDALGGVLDIFHDVGAALSAFASVALQAVKDLLGGVVGSAGGTVKDLMAQVRQAVQEALRAVITFAAQLMKAVGWMGGVEALVRGLTAASQNRLHRAEDSTGMAVASGAMIKSIQDLAKGVYESAFVASAYGGQKADPQQQMVAFLGDIAKDIESMPNTMRDKLLDLEASIMAKVENGWTDLKQFVEDQELDGMIKQAGKDFTAGVKEVVMENIMPYLEVLKQLPGAFLDGGETFAKNVGKKALGVLNPLSGIQIR